MIDDLRLFDNIERTYMDWAKHSEPRYNFLNRSGRSEFAYIRSLLELWFQQFDTDYSKRYEIHQEFRSEKINQHVGSFFEIYIYTLFQNLGFNVEPNPKWSKRSPDFLMTDSNGQRVLLECTNVFNQEYNSPNRSIENHLIDYLNDNLVCNDYALGISFNTSGKSNLPLSQVCIKVQEWIDFRTNSKEGARPDFSATMYDKNSLCTWSEDDWYIQFSLYSRPSELKSNIAGIGYGLLESTPTQAIRRKLKKKYRRYGNPNMPYIIAINIHDWINSRILFDTLYGDEERIVWDDYTSSLERNNAGAWLSQSNYQMTRVSGLLIFDRLNYYNMHQNEPILIKHPKPNYPLKSSLPFVSDFENTGKIDMSSYLKIDNSRMPI